MRIIRVYRIKNDKNFRDMLSAEMLLIYDIGVATGLRISDIIDLKIETALKPRPYIMQKKTNKRKRIFLSENIRKRVKAIAKLSKNEYLFYSSRTQTGHLSRQAVYCAFKKVADLLEIQHPIGTHCMRKKYASEKLKRSKGDLVKTQKALQHESISDTALYIYDAS